MQDVSTLPLNHGVPSEEELLSLVRPRPRPWLFQWRETMFRSVLLFAVAQMWIVQGYKVYGSCMEPNLFTGERVLGSKMALTEGIHRGDVVVFSPPHRPQTSFIKRVVGLPGEVLEIRNNHVYVNNHLLDEPYLHRQWHDDRPPERIPSHMLFVMGDNRDHSSDSRAWGELPVKNVQAKAWFRYWPPERVGRIE